MHFEIRKVMLALLVMSGAVVIVMQGCSVTRLKRDSLKLQALQKEADRTQKDLERARKVSLRHEFDAHSLRTEAGRLREELKSVRQELTQARQEQATVSSSRGVPGDSGTRASQPARKEPLIHLMPEVLARLQPHSIDTSTLTHSTCIVDGVWLQNNLARDDVNAGPDWEPSRPVPLSSREAEWKARQEIRRLFRDGDQWVVHAASLHDVSDSRKWYYSIGFRSPDRKAHFSVYVSMSGAIGTTTLGRNIHEEISGGASAPAK
jgi:hypothetical protein